MHNQYPSQPNQEPAPKFALEPGEERDIDTENEVIDGRLLGFDQETLDNFHVFGTLDFRNTAGKKEGKVALLKGSFNGASETVYVVGLTRDEDGKRAPMPSSHWMSLERNMPTEFGRAFKSDELLFGREFTDGTSRHQMTLTWEGQGVRIQNVSKKNKMKFDGDVIVSKPDDSVWENFSTDGPESSSTKTGGFMVGQVLPPPTLLQEAQEGPVKDPTDEAGVVFAELKALTNGLNQVEVAALYNFAAGSYNQSNAIRRGQKLEADYGAWQAGMGWNDMSERARGLSSEYSRLFAKHNDLLTKK